MEPFAGTAGPVTLEERLSKLAADKANLELITHLMRKMSAASGLENVIEDMLTSIIEGIGGSNLVLYYWVDSALLYADALGERRRLERLCDPLAERVLKTRQPQEREHTFRGARLRTPELTPALTWVYPLIAGDDLVGILRLEGLYLSTASLKRHLTTFFGYAATLLKNEIYGASRLRHIHEQITAANADLKAEVDRRRRAEGQLQAANEGLGREVFRRTAELSESEQRYRSLFREINAGVALCEIVRPSPGGPPALRLLDVNPAFEALVRRPREAMVGRTVCEVFPGVEEEWGDAVRRVVREGQPVRRVAYLPHLGLHVDATLFRPGAGRVAMAFTDITERVQSLRRQEEFAREARNRAAELQSILDTMVEAVLVSNAQGEIVLVNQSGVRLFGLGAGDRPPLRLEELPARFQMRDVDGRPLDLERMALNRALRGETVLAVDEVIRPAGGRSDALIRVSAAPIGVDRGGASGAVLVARDITELRELERLKDQFLSVAAHELKTPVAVMKGFAQALLRKGDDLSDPRRRMVEAINRGADRIDTLILDLLDISRMAEGHLELTFERIDLHELIEAVVHPMALTAPKHRLRVMSAAPVVTLGDRHRIEQVLSNLLANAVKYSPGGGDVDVALQEHGEEAVISVEDHGIGIAPEKQERIFERFYRAHTGTPHDYGGMGVGLCISREIVTRHGGRMQFESRENQGSVFRFTLPLR